MKQVYVNKPLNVYYSLEYVGYVVMLNLPNGQAIRKGVFWEGEDGGFEKAKEFAINLKAELDKVNK